MNLDIEELIKVGINRNIIIVDSNNTESGHFTDRLKSLMHFCFKKNSDDNLKITEILHYNGDPDEYDGKATYFFEKHKACLPYVNYQTEFLCIAINRDLIEKNGIKPEYVLLGAY